MRWPIMMESIRKGLIRSMKLVKEPATINLLKSHSIYTQGKILGKNINKHWMIWIFPKFRIQIFTNIKNTSTIPEKEIFVNQAQGISPLTLFQWAATRKDQKFWLKIRGTKSSKIIAKNLSPSMRKRADFTNLQTTIEGTREGLKGQDRLVKIID